MELQEFLDTLVAAPWRQAAERIAQIIQQLWGDSLEFSVYRNIANWNVPLRDFPKGYHCTPGEPLPFLAIAAQKQHFAIYHMGMYAKPELLEWFVGEYPKHMKTKLNMGKSCIRFTKPDTVPFALIEELLSKMPPQEWTALYEEKFLPKK